MHLLNLLYMGVLLVCVPVHPVLGVPGDGGLISWSLQIGMSLHAHFGIQFRSSGRVVSILEQSLLSL